VDLAAQHRYHAVWRIFPADVDGFRRHCLLNGLDDIGVTLEDADVIQHYEIAAAKRALAVWLPASNLAATTMSKPISGTRKCHEHIICCRRWHLALKFMGEPKKCTAPGK